MESKQNFAKFLEACGVQIFPLHQAPEYPQTKSIPQEFSSFHSNFKTALHQLVNFNELGLQIVVLGRILSRINLDPRIFFAVGDAYLPIINNLATKRMRQDLETRVEALKMEVGNSPVFNFFTNQATATKWINDFLWFYTDESLNMDISVVNFEVKKEYISTVYDHPDFFKVVVGLISYYPCLKNKLELNCNGFCTSAMLLSGTDSWILHFSIEKDLQNPQLLNRHLYISEKCDLKQEADAMLVEQCLVWAVKRGLSNIHILEKPRSDFAAMSSPLAKLVSASKIPIQKTSVADFNRTKTLLISLNSDEVHKRTESLFPNTTFEEKSVSWEDIDTLFDKTRLMYFILANEIKCMENSLVQNTSRCIVFDQWKAMIPIEKPKEWRVAVESEEWDNILSAIPRSTTAFEAPESLKNIPAFHGETDLYVKIEAKSNPFILEKLANITHANIMRVIKIITVDGNFVATVNEKLYPLKYALDKSNPNNRLGKSEIENILFCFGVINDAWCGLQHLYSNSIYYKDISFNNIMLSKDCKTAKLIDFEASCTDFTTWNQFSIYTNVYTPNEAYDQQSQIFSLTVILCELVFMFLAYHNRTFDTPDTLGFKERFRIRNAKEIPSFAELKNFILFRFKDFFPQHLYYIQFFVDTCLVEKKERSSPATFSKHLQHWIEILSIEQNLKKPNFKYSTLNNRFLF